MNMLGRAAASLAGVFALSLSFSATGRASSRLAATVTVAAALWSASASANLITNGSFESPVQAGGTWGVHSTMTGWSVDPVNKVEVRNNVAGAAQAGVNYIELDVYENSWIEQTVTTVADTFYTLSLWYSPRMSQPATTNTINVLWNGSLLTGGSLTGTGASSGNSWVNYVFTVKATDASSVLKFAAAGASDSYGGSLDNVSLTAVPLPPAAILFGSVLAGLAVVARKRGAAAAAA
ncbi:MAG: hypothetical protein CALGDGBN_02318 [Pseudomonadales bacterium]|nr:hypothetical protein [Pseudomonadales bacterium]